MPACYAVSAAARRAGVTVHQVRSYVSAGLVQPCATTPGGYFLFDEACVTRLRLIGAATRAGLHIREIEDLVRALGNNDWQALQAARQVVASAIYERRSAIENLQQLVNQCHNSDATEVAR